MRSQTKTLKQLFQRYRRPGDLVFAMLFLIISLLLVSQLGSQAQWMSSTKWASQPGLWPTIALIGMASFALLHFVSSLVSERIAGRWAEVAIWVRALEFVAWFMVYVWLVPRLGYLPSTVLFTLVMAIRMGYRGGKFLAAAAITAIAVVVIFKSFLKVKVPGGQVYEFFPDAIRSFMLTYL